MTTSTVSSAHPPPLPSHVDDIKTQRLSEGWHFTEKCGEVFVAPGGSAWAVQQSGERVINVMVSLNPSDIIKTPLLERRKQAITKQSYRKRRGKRTQTANLALSEAEDVTTMPDASGMK
jgi:hypothetical protein